MSEVGSGRLAVVGGIAVIVALGVVGAGIATRSHSEAKLAGWTQAQALPAVSVIHATAISTGEVAAAGEAAGTQAAPIYARTSGYAGAGWSISATRCGAGRRSRFSTRPRSTSS